MKKTVTSESEEELKVKCHHLVSWCKDEYKLTGGLVMASMLVKREVSQCQSCGEITKSEWQEAVYDD